MCGIPTLSPPLPPSPQDKTASLKDLRTMRNKGVLRLHERMSRDQAKKDEDDRGRRMEVWTCVGEG